MPQRAKKHEAPETPPKTLKGWQQIAAFLGEPTSVVSAGRPVECQFVGKAPTLRPRPTNSTLGLEKNPVSLCMSLLRIPTLPMS